MAALGANGALAASSKPTLTLKGKTIVDYTKTAKLAGTLSSGKKGVLVKLQRRVWPFKGSFKTVATTHTGAGGAYSFRQRPSLATKYRAVAPKAHTRSRTQTVYAVKSLKVLLCVFTSHGHTYQGCTSSPVPPGEYTWHLTLEFSYPASVFGKERGKPVYTYFAEDRRSMRLPKTLKRGKNVPQHRHGKSTTVVKWTKRVSLPHDRKGSYVESSFCTQTSERKDGFGLPGAPGSHKCGAATIPGTYPINKLG